MSLFDKIQKEMYAAMKSAEKAKATALRTVLAKLKDKQIEKRENLTEQEEIKVLQALLKQRKESIEMYRQGGRDDLVKSEETEAMIIESYLPQMMSNEDVKKLVQEIVQEVGAESMSDVGKVMPEVMRRGAGRIDGKQAQAALREILT